ncbi:MAG: hypothetical protein PWP23_2550 [Candidatus Sumerlaeota bacterium]|nr:hypothetical protein [Candidatus Sumerlaeota bacterium]
MMAEQPDIAQTLMAYLDGELSADEAAAFEVFLQEHPEWRDEAAQLGSVVEAADELVPRPAPPETWDNYWEEIDSRLAKPVGWILLGVGGALLASYGTVKILLLAENPWIRVGLAALLVGFFLLFLSVVRGHLTERPRDRYRRIHK